MKTVFTLILSILPVALMAQAGNEYKINGKIGNYNAPATVYLRHQANGQNVIDSALMVNGIFKFSGNAPDMPTQASLIFNKNGSGINRSRDAIQLFLEKGNINVHTTTDTLAKGTVDGSPTNVDLGEYYKMMKPATAINEYQMAKASKITPEQRESAEFKAEQSLAEKKYNDLASTATREFVKTHTGSFLSLILLNGLVYNSDYGVVEPLYTNLAPNLKETPIGKSLAIQLPKMKNVALGSIAPEFALPDTAGNVVKLSSLRGKYVLIDLWASWCGPCRAENPNVVKNYQKFKDKKFTIIGISLDRPGDKDKWLAAIKKDGLTWTQVSDLKFWQSDVAQLYGVTAIPQNFLLDPNGKIIGKNLRGDALSAKLAELL